MKKLVLVILFLNMQIFANDCSFEKKAYQDIKDICEGNSIDNTIIVENGIIGIYTDRKIACYDVEKVHNLLQNCLEESKKRK